MASEAPFLTSRLEEAIGWARKYSIFQYPFVTACCGMEYMATACSHYDVDRFGAGFLCLLRRCGEPLARDSGPGSLARCSRAGAFRCRLPPLFPAVQTPASIG